MTIYRAFSQDMKEFVEFLDKNDCINYANQRGMSWEIIEKDIEDETLDKLEKKANLEKDIKFGEELIKEFLFDNRIISKSFSLTDSLNLLVKFQDVEALCRLGDIKNVRLLLIGKETDEVFTEERKNKYIKMCEKHLNYGK